MDKFGVSLERMQEGFNQIIFTLMEDFLPILQDIAKWMGTLPGYVTTFIEKIKGSGISKIFSNILDIFKQIDLKLLLIIGSVIVLAGFISKLKFGAGGGGVLDGLGKAIGGFISGIAEGFAKFNSQSFVGMLLFAAGVIVIIGALGALNMATGGGLGEVFSSFLAIFDGLQIKHAILFTVFATALVLIAKAFEFASKIEPAAASQGIVPILAVIGALLVIGTALFFINLIPGFFDGMVEASQKFLLVSVSIGLLAGISILILLGLTKLRPSKYLI